MLYLAKRLHWSLLIAVLTVALSATSAMAATVSWEEATWDDYSGSITVNGDDELEVTSACAAEATSCWGSAHSNTPQDFRDAAAQVVTTTFVDEGPGTPGGQIWVEEESGTGGWTQFGAYQNQAEYRIFEWEYTTNAMLSVSTGVARTAGEHTLSIAKRADGTVDYYLDDALVYTAVHLTLDFIGDVYLAANSLAEPGTVTFTAYDTSTAYDGPPPPPVQPTTKDDCKNGGWQSYSDPAFANQGDCVSFVATGGRSGGTG